MFGLRSAAAVNLAFLLVLVVIPALLFGSVLHTLIPHSHDGGEMVWQELHAALRHDTKATVVFAAVLLTVLAPLFAFVFLKLAPLTFAADMLLTRGIHKYRKFR